MDTTKNRAQCTGVTFSASSSIKNGKQKEYWQLIGCDRVGNFLSNQKLRVMTYNIHRGIGNLRSNVDKMASALDEIKADVIGLTEVYRRPDGSLLKSLAEELDMYCEWGCSVRVGRGEIGNCILSKYPMSDCTNHLIHPFLVPWSCLEAYIKDVNCHFFVTHLASGIGALAERSRVMQAHDLLEIVRYSSGPKVLMGDFNTITSNSKVLSIVSKEFKDVLDLGGVCNRGTYPSFLPRLCLDHIFVARGVSVNHVNVPKMMLSDHLPVVAELSILRTLQAPIYK